MHAQLGSISHGTLNHEHLIETFSEELARFARKDRDADRRRTARAALDSCAQSSDDEGASLESLTDALEAYAPPFAYFGTTEGDGSDFGFWPAIDSLDEAARYRDGVIKVAAGDPWPKGLREQGIGFVMEVTDHGNVTLRHASNGREVWSVV